MGFKAQVDSIACSPNFKRSYFINKPFSFKVKYRVSIDIKVDSIIDNSSGKSL